jgi:hypothetical protein
MIRTFILTILLVLTFVSKFAAAAQVTLSESFSTPALDSRLHATLSSSSYSLGPLTPGATWQIAKQSGIKTGAAEIHTSFQVSGNFTADLLIDSSNLGTGEVGMRIGNLEVNPFAEIFMQGPDGGVGSNYTSGGYGLGGFGVSNHLVTLRLVRSGSQLQYFANTHLFFTSSFQGNAPITIFLRPYSGDGAYDPTVGLLDAHSAILDQFTLSAAAFVPEPSCMELLACIGIFVSLSGRIRHVHIYR